MTLAMHVVKLLLFLSSWALLGNDAASPNCQIERPRDDDILSRLFECIWIRYVKSYRFYGPGKAANLQGSVSSQRKVNPLLQRVRGLSIADIRKESRANMALNLIGDYNPIMGKHEVLSSHTLRKETQLLEAVSQTEIVRDTFQTLLKSGFLKPLGITSFKDFKTFMRTFWFARFGGKKVDHFARRFDRSGFEHVFAGEVSADGQQLKGLHSWIQVIRLEQKGLFDYYGCNYHFSDISRLNLVNIKFGRRKGVKATTIFIGTPLEFEMMLYTSCFLIKHGRPNNDRECTFRLQGRKLVVRTFPADWKKMSLATAYAFIKK